jgi:hypothetical protein
MDKTDRELLEAAAKAVGYSVARLSDDGSALCLVGMQQAWNPLTDDGDALRLAVSLNITVTPGVAWVRGFGWYGEPGSDLAATRRAIVRAAAAIVEKT